MPEPGPLRYEWLSDGADLAHHTPAIASHAAKHRGDSARMIRNRHNSEISSGKNAQVVRFEFAHGGPDGVVAGATARAFRGGGGRLRSSAHGSGLTG
jgi:hypothetical protein